ncbi:MAG TPA: hypothetical protein VLD65_11830, partial [Anaerolineales bacterium]|nr:hypothetical protein [Anaerolineales bacterium]
MTDIVCPLCGKTNPPDLNECQYCQAPLKPGGFIAPAEGESQKTEFPPFSEDTSSPEEPAAESMPAS